MKKIILIGIAGVVVVALWIGLRGSGESTLRQGSGQAEKESSGSSVFSNGASGLNESIKPVQSVDGLAYSAENLSDAVKALLGLAGEKQNYNSLEDAIAKLSKDLSADDVAALRDMLTWPNDKFPEGMRPIEINAVKNDMLDRLLRQNSLPEGIGLQMVEMASNPENDPVWRDYCVQFMSPFYERSATERVLTTESSEEHNGMASNTSESSSAAGGENEVDELAAVREAMFAALDERDSTIAGTSLIGLELLSRTHDEFDRESIVSSALDIASDESAASASRMTALRLAAGLTTQPSPAATAGKQEDTEYAENTASTARLLAQTGETVLLRSAAIVTLGETGSATDRELLESYTMSEDKQIAHAAHLALQKMDARN